MRSASSVVAHAGAAIVLLTGAPPLSAQPPAMSGLARHAVSGKPIECLHVALADSLDRTVAHTVTDAAGTFVVVAPDTGTFRVRFALAGYEPMQGPLLHMGAGEVSEQEYPVSFDDQIESALDLSHRKKPPTVVDLGDWHSAGIDGAPLSRGARRATEGEAAYASTMAYDIARVAAEMIIDANGRPRGSSWRTIASTNPMLVTSAKRELLARRYQPARIGEQPVCELQFVDVRSFRTATGGRP
jgi:hypothetical protein